jgi:hypothetical protein
MTVSAESVVQALEAMERYFRGGFGWSKYALHEPATGKKCLMGAVTSVHATDGNRSWVPHEAIAAATQCLRHAVRERGFHHVETFNDTRLFYGQIAALMARAKQIAMMSYARALPAPAPQVMPVRPALTYQQEQVVTVTIADMERVAVKRG